MPSLADIAIHRSERGLILGGTGTGKSTLTQFLITQFLTEYRTGRVLVLDSKPRFRCEWLPDGTSAAKRYKNWDHGDVTPGSMAVDIFGNPKQALQTCWMTGLRIAVAQSPEGVAAYRPNLLRLLSTFVSMAKASRPTLAVIDETLDFFHGNGTPIGGNDAILRVFRTGRELGMSGAAGSQRAKGIPIQLRSELSQAYVFKLDHGSDVRELWEFGFPRDAVLPTEDYQFDYWHKKTQRQPVLCQLAIPQ